MRSIVRRLLVLRLPQGAAARLTQAFDRAEPSAQRRLLSSLLARVYASAGPADRARLLEVLMRPLGLLSLAAVADGLFVSWRLRDRWGPPRVPAEETSRVRDADLAALAEHVLQVSTDILDGVAQALLASPVLLSSTSAALLLVLLMRRRQGPHDPELDP